MKRAVCWVGACALGLASLAHGQWDRASPDHVAAVERMLVAMTIERLLTKGITASVEEMRKSDPLKADAAAAALLDTLPQGIFMKRVAVVFARYVSKEDAQLIAAFAVSSTGVKFFESIFRTAVPGWRPGDRYTPEDRRAIAAFERTPSARALGRAMEAVAPQLPQIGREVVTEVLQRELGPALAAAEEVRREQARVNALRATEREAFLSGKLLAPQSLVTREGIDEGKRKLSQLEAFVERSLRESETLQDEGVARIKREVGAGTIGVLFLSALEGQMRKRYDLGVRFAENQRTLIALYRRFFMLAESRLGKIELQDGKLIFADDADLQAYRSLIAELGRESARERELIEESMVWASGQGSADAWAQPLTVRIGHAGPLSGRLAVLGKDNENGARLAIDEANEMRIQIGKRTVRFELVSEDDGANPEKAVAAARRLVDAGVAGVVGHLNSGASVPASEVYSRAGIAQITPSATSVPDASPGKRTTFRAIANDRQQGLALGAFIAADLRAKRVALVDDRTEYGRLLTGEVATALAAAGVSVVSRESVDANARDFREVLGKLRAANPDLVFHGGLDTTGAPMLKQMREAGMTPRFVQGDGGCDESFVRAAGTAAEGFTCAQSGVHADLVPADHAFRLSYEKRFGRLRHWAPHAYDAATMLIKAMQRADSVDPAKVLPELALMRHEGVTGYIEFDDARQLKVGYISVFEVREGRLVARSVRSTPKP